jgi:hypothetical protein
MTGAEKTMEDPAMSVSQTGPNIVIDTGKDSFAVDITPEPVEGKTEEAEAPAEPEEKAEPKEGEAEPKEGEEEPAKTKEKEEAAVEEKKKEEGGEEEPPLPKGVQKRIDVITRKRREAERQTEALFRENEELKKLIQTAETEKKISLELEEPDIDKFETEEEYQKAIIDYRVNLALAKQAEEVRKEQAVAAQREQERIAQKKLEDIQASLSKGYGKYDDFEEAIKDLNVTSDMLYIMDRLPNMADVAYYLGKNLNMTSEIVDMAAYDAAFKLKEISDTLKSKRTTKAPAPIKPVVATGGDVKTPEQMSMAEYMKYRDKQEKERRGRY